LAVSIEEKTKCTECGIQISNNVDTCPHCGAALVIKSSEKNISLKSLFFVFIIIIILSVYFLSFRLGVNEPDQKKLITSVEKKQKDSEIRYQPRVEEVQKNEESVPKSDVKTEDSAPKSYVKTEDKIPNSKSVIYQSQKALKEMGFDPGVIDGIWGKKTKRAVTKFQKQLGLQVTGGLDKRTLEELEISAESSSKQIVGVSKDIGIKQLYNELMNFKDDAEFHRVGFGVCCKYKSWQTKVETFRKTTNLSFQEKVAAGNLLVLGLEYMKTKGFENNYTRRTKATISELVISSDTTSKHVIAEVDRSSETSFKDKISVWKGEGYYNWTTTVKRENGKLIMIAKYDDGSVGRFDLKKSRQLGQTRYDEIGNEKGEYYLVNHSGDLEIYDTMGLITTQNRIR